jgi:hypothetical protein
MDWRRLVFGLDWTTRTDFILSFIFDWRKWLWGLVPSGGGMTFLWAAIVMAALAFVVFVVLKVVERTKDRLPPRAVAAGDWRGLLEAVDVFGEESLVATRNKWREQFMSTDQDHFNSQRQMAALMNYADPEKQEELERQKRLNRVAVLGHDMATDELRRAWADLRADIGRRLQDGELVAKGIPAPYAAGKGEVEISAHEWRVLEISPNEKSEANEKGSGAPRYVGVVVGKRK